MKKIITIICSMLAITAMADDNAILEKIEKANSSVEALQASFRLQKVSATSASRSFMKGDLYYAAPDKFAQHYSDPATDVLIINSNQFYMVRGQKKNLFDVNKNAPMRSLSNTLLNCMQGKLKLLASGNDAEVSVTSDKDYYIITFTARKKQVRGYQTIMLKYAKSNHLLCYMQMVEFNGNSSDYIIENHVQNGKVDANKFKIPKM